MANEDVPRSKQPLVSMTNMVNKRKLKVICPHLKVLRLIKGDFPRIKTKAKEEEMDRRKRWENDIKEWTGKYFTSTTKAVENRTRQEGN